MPRLAVLVVLLAAALLAPAAATAAPYTVHTCRTPAGAPAPADGWDSEGTKGSGKVVVDDCATGGSLRAFFDPAFPHGHTTSIGLAFKAPADTTIAGYDIDRLVRLSQAADGSSAYNYGFLRDRLAFAGDNQTDLCQPRRGCTVRDGVFSEAGLALRRFFMFTDCSTSAGTLDSRCPAGGEGLMQVRSARIRLDDTSAPAFTGAPGGSLLDTTSPVRGIAEATFGAADRGSGLREAVLLVDGAAVASRPLDAAGASCAEPYVRVVPCPLESSGRLSIDTASLPDGPHDVALRLSDATGANTTGFGPVRITTANAPPPSPPAPLAPPPPRACLERPPLAVTGKLARSTVAFGASAVYSGRVLDAARRPVAGAKVEVRDSGALVRTVTAGSTGRFSLRIPRGANRALRASVAVRGGLACSSVRRLRVRAGASLSLSPRRVTLGQAIRFTGRVRGAVPRGGKLLILQARDRDGRWRPVRTARTNGAGRFRTSFRFRSSRGRFTYRFRIQVPRERGFAYALGFSRSRPVLVVGR